MGSCVLRGLSWLYKVRLHLPVPGAAESETTYLAYLCSTMNFCQHHWEPPQRTDMSSSCQTTASLETLESALWEKGFPGTVHFQGRFASATYANLEFASTTTNLCSVTCGGSLDKVELSHRSLFSTLFFPEWVELNLMLREAWLNCHVIPEQL